MDVVSEQCHKENGMTHLPEYEGIIYGVGVLTGLLKVLDLGVDGTLQEST